MIKYTLTLDINEEQLSIKDGETFDSWVAGNIFNIVADKLEAEGIEGGVGFAHYAHHYCNGHRNGIIYPHGRCKAEDADEGLVIVHTEKATDEQRKEIAQKIVDFMQENYPNLAMETV